MSNQTSKATDVADAKPSASAASDCCSPAGDLNAVSDKLALISGSVLLRVWLGVRAIQSGIEKFATTTQVERLVEVDGVPNDYGLTEEATVKAYEFGAYKGIPPALEATFSDQPLIPAFMLPVYNIVLGPALLILGFTVLLGIASRASLFLLGMLYVSLTWGLILLGSAGDAGVAWLGTHIILIVLALQLTRHDPLRVLKKW